MAGLTTYKKKRNFGATPEPAGSKKTRSSELVFVVQRHKASHLHYDFRIELDGVLKSWAIPKGPSMNPEDKRLAVMVEDHPFDYKDFEGIIPKGNYGAGTVEIWDKGAYSSLDGDTREKIEKKIIEGIRKGDLKLRLSGKKLKGEFALVKLKKQNPEDNAWLMIKHKDQYAVDIEYDSEQARENQPRGSLMPMLAKEIPKPFDSDEWIFEIKWDGYRAIADIYNGDVKLYSRNGNMFNAAFPVIADDLKNIRFNAVLDGEIVVLDEDGKPDFGKLQDYDSNGNYSICYYVFDILSYNDLNLCGLPLSERKKLLLQILKVTPIVRYTDHIERDGISFFNTIKEFNMEGIMAKKSDSLYYPAKRTPNWLKIKTHRSSEVTIAGFTEPAGGRKHFGSLVVATTQDSKLKYAGNVGTGFNDSLLKEIYLKLKPLICEESGFDHKIPSKTPVTWVIPEINCEVKYSEITRNGIMRHPVFVKLLDKKPVKEKIIKQQAVKGGKADKTLKLDNITVKISNYNKIYFPDNGVTKGMIVEYYQKMADYILPYLNGRPQSLKRNPSGITNKGFYHKDAGDEAPSWVESIKIASESSKKDIDYILCNNKATLAYLNNLGCIELNPWHSTVKALENPDYLIIDIDPSPDNTFDEVVETAQAAKEILDHCGAPAFCKTSGATGLHIYIPLGKKYDYDVSRDFANIICDFVHELVPQITTMERSVSKRGKKIYLDYLQNRRGQTIASVYSVRPVSGTTVSAPLQWNEIKKGLSPQEFDIYTVPDRLKKLGDLFKGTLGKGIDVKKCLKALTPVV